MLCVLEPAIICISCMRPESLPPASDHREIARLFSADARVLIPKPPPPLLTRGAAADDDIIEGVFVE